MTCFVCGLPIAEGTGIVLSAKYQVYCHIACNVTNTCFVCRKKFRPEKPLIQRRGAKKYVPDKYTMTKDIIKIGSRLYRHSWCEPGSLSWCKAFKDTMPDIVKRIYKNKGESTIEEPIVEVEEPIVEGAILRRRTIED